MRTTVINEATNWVGYLEKKSNAQLEDFTANAGSSNYTIFAKWYNEWWRENYQAQPWCAMFVSCVIKLALGTELFPHFSYCPTGVNNFKKAEQWITGNPQSGDVIFYKDDKGVACHVGIVERVDNAKVYTIEGNTSSAAGVVANGGCVARKSYALNYNKILGYGRPVYSKLQNGDELTMAQYEELIKKIDALAAKIPAPPMVYAWIDNNMPDWAKPTIEKLYNNGFLKGDNEGKLNLTDDMLRILVILDRAGAFSQNKGV